MALQTSQRPPAMFNPWSSSSQDPTNNDDTTSAPRGPLPAMYPPRPIGRLHNAAAVNGNSHAAGHIGPASSQTRSTSSLLSQALHPQQQLQHQQQSQNHRFRDRPAKDTSHVPCKFFRTGECQAGRACPFSHNLDTPEQPCRYFAKGTCKYGAQCALAHVTRDGRVVNRPSPLTLNGQNRGKPQMRVMPSPGITEVQLNPVEPMIDRELPIGLPQYNGHPYYPFNGNAQYDFQTDNRPDASNIGFVPQPLYQTALNPEINVERPSPPEVPGGATLDTRQAAQKGLSILDVPFPASLDSNAIGWNASHAPLAKSAPGRAGMPMSSPKVLTPALAKDIWDNSPFAPNSPGSAKYSRALSPQNLGESLFARRQISSQRVQAADGSSSSVPRLGKISNFDDINETMVEEDFIPDSLQDLLTPAEKSRRRYSGREDEPSGLKKRVDSFGSMSATSLSSQRPTSPNYGPIGSPLRNSSMPFPESRTFSGQNKAPTNGVGHAQGPAQPSQQPPQRTPRLIAIPATPNISALSSQLKRVRLNRENGNMLLRPSLAETLAGDSQPSPQRAQTCGSGGTDGVGAERFRGRRDDMSPQRASSVLSDEEVFSMDVEHP